MTVIKSCLRLGAVGARSSLTSHHAIGSLLVAVVTGGDWVMEARGRVAQCVAKG